MSKDEKPEPAYYKEFFLKELSGVILDCMKLGMGKKKIDIILSYIKNMESDCVISLMVGDINLISRGQFLINITKQESDSFGDEPFSVVDEKTIIRGWKYGRGIYSSFKSPPRMFVEIITEIKNTEKNGLLESIKWEIKGIKWTDEKYVKVALALDLI